VDLCVRINEGYLETIVEQLIIHKYRCHKCEWYYSMELRQQHKIGDFTIDPRSSNQSTMVQLCTMKIDVLKSNTVRNLLITNY
jgi:hypothetical protein